jgi:Tfp pilus assembly protein PilF
LGESIADVRANGKPLAEITTPSLEALRLYTLARDASIQRYDLAESLRLIELALKADPNFALAYSARARLRMADGDFIRAKQDFLLANQHRDRMSAREAMILDSGLAEFGPVQKRVDIWKTLTRIYPDYYGAYFHIGYNQALYLQHYEEAVASMKPVQVPQNPFLSENLYMTGIAQLGMEKIKEARTSFERAESLGARQPVRFHADSYAVTRDYRRAQQLLDTQKPTGFAGADIDARLPQVTYPLDRGEWNQAVDAAKSLFEHAEEGAALHARTLRATWLGLRGYAPDASLAGDWRKLVEQELPRARNAEDPDVVSSTFSALFGASQLARLGDVASAKATLSALETSAPELGYPAVDDMLAILRAEIALAEGSNEGALAALRPRLTGGELGRVHSVLLRTYRRVGSLADARREAEWLSTHRGRAYMEWNSQYLLQPLNVLETDLALLDAAEIATEAGDATAAQRDLARFKSAWKNPPAFVARRVGALEAGLSRRK